MSTFQIIVFGVCAALILIGVGVFASFGGIGSNSIGKVVIWGTEDRKIMEGIIAEFRNIDGSFQEVSYVEKNPATYQNDLLNAMAAGTSPDLITLSENSIYPFEDKLLTIPYRVVSQSSFINSFIDGAQIFLTSEGVLALPFKVDPLVMYWNRDLFASAGIAVPPQFWNELLQLAPKITSLDAGSNIKRSAVALGQWQNIAHAKEILSTLFFQTGENIIHRNNEGKFDVVFGTTPTNAPSNPAESVLLFYTEFANPSKTSYAWNRTLPLSTTAFIAGDVAVYFGFASEYPSIAARNPNLRFAVAKMPQIEGTSKRTTYGRLVGLAIPRNASNASGAAYIAQQLAGVTAGNLLTELTGLPPVRRDIKPETSSDAAMGIFVDSALIVRGWIDPDQKETDIIFKNMIESVISGRQNTGGAVGEASRALFQLVSI